MWLEQICGVLDRLERRVRAEVGDSPPARPERERERQGTEVVLLPGETGDQCDWPDPEAPAAGKPEHAPTDDTRGEVLLRHGRLPALPSIAELVKEGDEDPGEHEVDRCDGEEPVEDCLCRGLVEHVESGSQLGDGVRGIEQRVVEQRSGSDHERGGLGRGHTLGEEPLHRPNALEIVRRVQPQAAFRAGRAQQAVTTFPCPQELRAHAGAPAQFTDSEGTAARHGQTIQHLYESLTRTAIAVYGRTNKLSTGGVQHESP